MSTNNIPNGFIITVEKVLKEEKNTASVLVSPKHLGEHIINFIESRLAADEQINVKLSVGNWDETYDFEEFRLKLSKNATTIGNKDFSTNYWIEM